jgi:hypothetical protein
MKKEVMERDAGTVVKEEVMEVMERDAGTVVKGEEAFRPNQLKWAKNTTSKFKKAAAVVRE